MADEVPANPDSAPESGEPTPSETPSPGKKPSTPLEEEILRAAQQAIAGLGDLANDVSNAGGGAAMDDPNDLISQAMAEHAAESAAGQRFALPTFETTLTPAQQRAIELLSDVNLNVKIELGRTRMLVEDVLKLGEGAVVELDKLAGDPVDVYVNERHVARGEVLVLNDNFCVRISEIIAPINGKEDSPAA
jgi:flagellar motor switch protein FliN/FliY